MRAFVIEALIRPLAPILRCARALVIEALIRLQSAQNEVFVIFDHKLQIQAI